jgi:hypothetical protein
MHDTPDTTEPQNEILAAAAEVKAKAEAAAAAGIERGKHWPLAKIGLGVSIGSAAVAAAVLFANRDRQGK